MIDAEPGAELTYEEVKSVRRPLARPPDTRSASPEIFFLILWNMALTAAVVVLASS